MGRVNNPKAFEDRRPNRICMKGFSNISRDININAASNLIGNDEIDEI